MGKAKTKGANKHVSEEQKEIEIKKLRHELTHLKPGDSVVSPEENIKFPKKLKVNLYGTTGIGKSSLLNSLQFAFKGELTELTVKQTSTANFQGGHTVRRLQVRITKHLTFIDNRGVGPEDFETKEAAEEILRQLEGKSSPGEKVEFGGESSSKNNAVNKDERIYCAVLVFDARNSQSAEKVVNKFVEVINEWQGCYPLAVITNVDGATKGELDNMYAVLSLAGLSDIFEVANIITDKTNPTKREELSLDHQLNLLSLMKRCINVGDCAFELRGQIEFKDVQQAEKRKREAEEEREKQAELEKEEEEKKKAKEADDAQIAKERKEKEEQDEEKKRAKDARFRAEKARNEALKIIFFGLFAIFLVLIGMWLGPRK